MPEVNYLSLNDICVAIIGETPPHIIEVLSGIGIAAEQIHSISFVEASNRSEWLVWQELLAPQDFGIGRGSAGCLLAHRDSWLTWKTCKHNSLLILEDDVIFTKYGKKHFAETLERFVKSDLHLLHLGDHAKYNPQKIVRLIAGLNFREFFKITYERFFLKISDPKFVAKQFPFSGHAYILRTDLARVLTQNSESFLYPVDVHLNAVSQVSKNRVAKVRTPLLLQAEKRISQIKERGR
jgi:GR25 family glycosyltransferase involved in LPS biosynthesis